MDQQVVVPRDLVEKILAKLKGTGWQQKTETTTVPARSGRRAQPGEAVGSHDGAVVSMKEEDALTGNECTVGGTGDGGA